jgi:hypothetical protein
VPDEDLERPPLVPRWVFAVVVVLAIVGVFALISWVVRLAFGVARGLFFIVVVIGVIALVRAVVKRR